MINLRSYKEDKFSLLFWFTILLVLNIEMFFFFADFNTENENSCNVAISIIYPNILKSSRIIAQLLSNWKTSTENQFTIISVPRNMTKGIVVVIPFVGQGNQKKFMNLLETISSISNHSTEMEKLSNTLTILFESDFKYHGFIQRILTEFTADVLIGFLRLVKVPDYSSNGLHSYFKISLLGNQDAYEMCKSLCMLSKASVYLSLQGSYAWFLNDDVEILSSKFISDALKFVGKFTKPWSVLDFSDHTSGSFTGKLVRMNDINKFAFFFLQVMSQPFFRENEKALFEAHLDYVHLMYQSNHIAYRPSLMLRRSQMGDEDGLNYLGRSKWRSNDPSGVVMTSMVATDFKHSAMRAYGSLANHYFEAKSTKYGDWFAIVFDDDVHLDRVILELDFRISRTTNETISRSTKNATINQSLSEELFVDGILEASPKLMKLDVQRNILSCSDYIFIGNARSPTTTFADLQSKLLGRPTKCLKFTISSMNPVWNLIIKQIAVFSDD